MFTGIIESSGSIISISSKGTNKVFWVASPISSELKPDQSVAHDGVCLTVEEISDKTHRVTAVQEKLEKTNMIGLQVGDSVNLERCLRPDSRLDGHIVQGHVDTTATCTAKEELNGSWKCSFHFPEKFARLIIEKGSICVNGISLTAFDVSQNSFTVAIIPYTFEHTNMQQIKKGDKVNIEFDMVGKYVVRGMELGNRLKNL